MRIKTLSGLMLAGMLTFSSCVNNGDIDELQDQIDNLNSTVEALKKTQQEALLAAIANLEADLAGLEASLGDLETDLGGLGADYDALFADLGLLDQEVKNNANTVYYGNVITEADYTAFAAQEGATIITGRVVVSGNAHVSALANIKLIGKSLEIKGGSTITLPALKSVGENLMVSDLSSTATINLASLASIGGDVKVMNNEGLTEFIANELLLIGGGLSTKENSTLATLSFAKLDQVSEINIDEFLANDPNYTNIGMLTTLNLSGANVNGDVFMTRVGDVDMVSLGNIKGGCTLTYSYIKNISINGESIGDDFSVQYNAKLQTIETPNLTKIEGGIDISGNIGDSFAGFTSLTVLPSFPALKYIGGDLTISSNTDLTSADSFNAVTEITGNMISISGNGNFESMTILNALTNVYHNYNYASVNLSVKTNWFNGFGEVTQLNNVNVEINALSTDDGGFGGFSTNSAVSTLGDVIKLEGFGKLTRSYTLQLRLKDVTDFSAFASYTSFTDWQVGLYIQMPANGVGMCSMASFLTRVKTGGDFDNKPVKFEEIGLNEWNWPTAIEVDRDTAVDQLLAPCM